MWLVATAFLFKGGIKLSIILKSEILEVKKIKKKTRAKMFENLEVGDKIRLSIAVEHAGTLHSSSGTMASYITAENLETGETTRASFNQMPRRLEVFEFKMGER